MRIALNIHAVCDISAWVTEHNVIGHNGGARRIYLGAAGAAAAGESDKWRLIMLCNRPRTHSLAYTHSHLIYTQIVFKRVCMHSRWLCVCAPHASDKRRSPINMKPPRHHGNKRIEKAVMSHRVQCSSPPLFFLSTPFDLWTVT